ncbi:MAG: ComEC/Rec2 family competence protein [Bacteroidales bacterium]|nr:ComEC/Rec2 family competence protein [Bacteroidales bacterium]
MINWHKYPFLRLLIPFALGIWMSFSCLNLSQNDVKILLAIVVFMGVALLVTASVVRNYRYRWVFGMIMNLHLILIGVAVVHIRDDDLDADCDVFVARLAECPAEKEKSVKVLLKMQSDNSLVMTYFEKNERSMSLRYGDVIAFNEPPKLVEPPKNPEQFDYQKYLFRKGVLRQVYLKSGSWEKLNYTRANPVYEFSYRLRDFLLKTMRGLGINDDEYAVAAAILLGYDDTLPTELRQKYVAAGSMHILCVSGMHVGVVFMVFSYLLAFLGRYKQPLLLLLIWFYALLAGLAPSILRATIMLSFVIVGDMLKREGVLVNSIAASAFLLLCIKPANLFDVGFLLSYCAVIGIVTLQKPIYRLVYTRFKFLDKIWELTSVTLAAQIATAPLSIYYFHQFPSYFWLSNLFMGPISTVVIIGGMIMLLVFFIPYINIGVAYCVKWMVYVMNNIVSWIESLPFSIVKGLYVNGLEFVCLIIAILLLMMTIEYKKKYMIYGLLSVLLVFSVSQLHRSIVQRNRMSLAIYSLNKNTAVDFVCGNGHVLLCDTIAVRDPSVLSFSIENNLIKEGVYNNGVVLPVCEKNFENFFMKKRGNIVSFCGKTIGFVDEKSTFSVKLPYRPHLDFFVVYGNKNIDVERLLNCYIIDLLVIDGSVPNYLSERILRKAVEMGQECHDVKRDGALVLKL